LIKKDIVQLLKDAEPNGSILGIVCSKLIEGCDKDEDILID
jgi:hypothetical protein